VGRKLGRIWEEKGVKSRPQKGTSRLATKKKGNGESDEEEGKITGVQTDMGSTENSQSRVTKLGATGRLIGWPSRKQKKGRHIASKKRVGEPLLEEKQTRNLCAASSGHFED